MALKFNHSFKIDIFLIFIPLFLFTFFSIRFYSHYQYSRDVFNISHNFPILTNDNAINELNEYLKPAGVTKITAELLQNKNLNVTAPDTLNDLKSMLDTYPQLANIHLLDSNGNLVTLMRISTSAQPLAFIPHLPANAVYVTESLDAKKNRITWSYYDANQQLISSERTDEQIDPRNNIWYQGAISNRDYWMGTYKSNDDDIGITIAYPIINNGKVLGVVAVDFNALAINDFLTQLQQNLKSTLFIISDQGIILNGSTPATGNAPSSDDLIDAALADQALSGTDPHTFQMNGVQYLVDINNYQSDYGNHWRIGTILPLQTLIAQVHHTDQLILYFSFSMLFILIILVFWVTHRLAKPLRQLAHEILKIKALDFANIHWPKSHITEVNQLEAALNATTASLENITHYLPQALTQKLIDQHIPTEVIGERHMLSLMFSSSNFAMHTTRMDANEIAIHLSLYLNALSQIILKTEGFPDNYLNASIKAFWGAPTKDALHVEHAALAALFCRNKVQHLNAEWKAVGKPTFKTYFALHTGNVIVGNIGSEDKLKYTVLGEQVNIASSLSRINKMFDTEIIVSQAFYKIAHRSFLMRPIDSVKLAGREQPMLVYELIAALTEDAPAELRASPEQQRLCELSYQAFDAFLLSDLTLALRLYQEIAAQYPDDAVAKIFIKRCQT